MTSSSGEAAAAYRWSFPLWWSLCCGSWCSQKMLISNHEATVLDDAARDTRYVTRYLLLMLHSLTLLCKTGLLEKSIFTHFLFWFCRLQKWMWPLLNYSLLWLKILILKCFCDKTKQTKTKQQQTNCVLHLVSAVIKQPWFPTKIRSETVCQREK